LKLIYRYILILLVWVASLASSKAYSQNTIYTEYELKAGMIQRFIKYMTPSPKILKANDLTIRIGILGEDPFGTKIEQVSKGRSVNGKKIEVFRAKEIKNLESCHVVIICHSEQDRIREIIAHANKNYIVTIGDNLNGFCQLGGMVNFTEKNVFEVNLDAARKYEVMIDSQMLKLITPDRIVVTDSNVKE